ncbi:sensor histidine kinase [Raineyella sp. LH-20]|uniref:sensor histidine kinase n=1 Tax=Raineyella sp. LH-20 TaxID=3081204 RepID=UPI002954F76C|nr:histidine kinase [Raineyella sp. LH-20]WOP17991.1 histidine kinase [Raineyella sp. LH-20]
MTSTSLSPWLRWSLAVFLTVSLADDVARALAGGAAEFFNRNGLMDAAGVVLMYLALYLTLWRTTWAVLACAPLIPVILTTGDDVTGIITGTLIILLAPMTTRWPFTTATWVVFLGWLVAASARHGAAWHQLFWPVLLMFFVAGSIGTAVRGFQSARAADRRQLKELREENLRIREDERAALARELHDVVAHELSIISLQITSRSRTDDPAELHQVLDSVKRSTHSALYELRLLVGLLRENGSEESDLGHLNDDTSVVGVADQLRLQLTDLGHTTTCQVPAEVDELPATLTRTLIRILQESSTNIVKHAAPGGPCQATIRLTPEEVVLMVTNPLGTRTPSPDLRRGPSGWGLRGIAERIDLLGGGFSAGPEGDRWVVRASIPLSADELA